MGFIIARIVSFAFSVASAALKELGPKGLDSMTTMLKGMGLITDTVAESIASADEPNRERIFVALLAGALAAAVLGPAVLPAVLAGLGVAAADTAGIVAAAAVETVISIGVAAIWSAANSGGVTGKDFGLVSTGWRIQPS